MTRAKSWRGVRVYTIGHSTRTLEELVAPLHAFGVSTLVDIRTIPRSRHNPQFNGDALPSALRPERLRYVHLPELGGLRRPRKDSPNIGWRNTSFRGFADYMLTDAFEAGLEKLHALTIEGTVALMCAEAVPWRCHRSLIADALTARGAHVEHISSAKGSTPHRMAAFAEVNGTRVLYPGEDSTGGRLVTRAPFHLEATVRVLQRRPTNLVDVWGKERYQRVLATADELVLIEVANRGTIDDPDVRFTVAGGRPSPAARSGLARTVRRMLGLDVDPEPLQRLAGAERRLQHTACALRGMRPPRFSELFEAFANVIPFQQVSLDAGVAVVGRLIERYGRHLEAGGRRFHAFPPARVIAGARPEALRTCGLSSRKAESLRYIARAIASGDLTEEGLSTMSADDAVMSLTELPSIGPWSASVLLLGGLGRLDVFPPGDVGAMRGLRAVMHLGPEASLSRVVERFGDHRGYLYFYALGGSLLAKGHIHAAPSPP